MKNAATGIGLAILGIGIAVNGLNLNGNQANATTAAPVAFNAGPEEPVIVWYQTHYLGAPEVANPPTNPRDIRERLMLLRAWSDGRVEGRFVQFDTQSIYGCVAPPEEGSTCPPTQGWFVISSPNEGLNAAADINHDEIVNAADIGLLVAAWGDAPRNPMPPSDCPLGLIQ